MPRYDARDKLVGRQSSEGQSPGPYVANLHLNARRGYPAFDATKQEELALQASIRGLQPALLWSLCVVSSPLGACANKQQSWGCVV